MLLDQFGESRCVDWFLRVGRNAECHGLHRGIIGAGKHDDGNLLEEWILYLGAAKAEAVDVRHHQIEQNDAGSKTAAQQSERLCTILGNDDAIAACLQVQL